MRLKILALLKVSLMCTSVQATQADVSACRAVLDPAERLVCYDRIPLGPTPESLMGLESARARAASAPEFVETRIDGRFMGWEPRMSLRLANGQIWQVTDDSSGSYDLFNPTVIIRRGLMSSFFIEFPQLARSVRVKRLQ